MAKTFCKYHSKQPAIRHCPECQIDLCTQCVKTETYGNNKRYLCPVCKSELTSLGTSNVITPFWERFPKFFTYPFNMDSLIYILVFSLLSIVTMIPSIFSFLIYLVIMYALLRYGYAVMMLTAMGNLNPPRVGFHSDGIMKNNLPLKQLVVFIIMGVFNALIYIFLDATIGAIVTVLLILITPASMMVLALNDNILDAVNPKHIFFVIINTGAHYLALLVFIVLLSAGMGTLMSLALTIVPYGLLMPVSTFLDSYFIIVMFNMMGYIIFQNHEDLGYEVDMDSEDLLNQERNEQATQPVCPVMQEVNILIQEGKLDEAKARLRNELNRDTHNRTLHTHYHQLLVKTNDAESLVKHAKEYIQVLLGQNRSNDAVELCATCFRHNKDFRPRAPEATYELAKFAFNLGKHDVALNLLNKFDKFYPNNSLIIPAGFLMSKVLCEGKGKDQKALQILDAILGLPSIGDTRKEVEEYREFVAKLVANHQQL